MGNAGLRRSGYHAAGAFVQGASIELSADAPMREPYVCYMQGGLTYESGKLGILLAADKITKAKATVMENGKWRMMLSCIFQFFIFRAKSVDKARI